MPDGSVIDLRREPDELLLRVLLAADAPVAVIVRNNHADIVDERSQRALLDLVAPTATVRFHRSTPDSSTAIVTATPIDPSTDVASAQLAHVPRHRLAQPPSDEDAAPSPTDAHQCDDDPCSSRTSVRATRRRRDSRRPGDDPFRR